jgi:hypothetical protein
MNTLYIKRCNYAVSGLLSNELSSINMVYERKLLNRSQTSEWCYVPVYVIILY